MITLGSARPVRCLIPATCSAVLIRSASACCVSWSWRFGSGSKRSR